MNPDKKKYFGTDGIRGKVGTFPITPEFFLKLGWAVGKVFAGESKAKILIGKDTRVSGYMFEAALEAGLSAAGANSRLLGPMPTPAIAYLTRTFRAQAGIVISASHNPFEDNGVKFFSSQGFKLSNEIELAIEEAVDQPMVIVDSSDLGKAKRVSDAPGRYIEFCKSTIGSDVTLNGLKIIVDCANGATYHVAPAVMRELGADVITIGDQPDGFNINQECGSTAVELLQQKVIEEDADLGIAFDGDGDRVIMVDHKGEVVDGDELLYIMASDQVKNERIHGGVVGTLMSNLGVERAIRDLGLEFVRSKVGDKYVLAELLKHNWTLGGESSGHIICRNYMTTGDGIVSAMQILRALMRSDCILHDAKSKCVKLPQLMLNVKYSGKINPLETSQVEEALSDVKSRLGDRGRVLLRASGTEPLIRVMVEGEDDTEIRALAKELAGVVEGVCR